MAGEWNCKIESPVDTGDESYIKFISKEWQRQFEKNHEELNKVIEVIKCQEK